MAADFRIRPLGDRVVVKPADREEKTKGGIYLPDTASRRPHTEALPPRGQMDKVELRTKNKMQRTKRSHLP